MALRWGPVLILSWRRLLGGIAQARHAGAMLLLVGAACPMPLWATQDMSARLPADLRVQEVSTPGLITPLTMVHLTDVHIGWGVPDYGSPGYDDQPAGEEGIAAQRLRQAVAWVNANAATEGITLVLVTGDITDSAERSEFLVARMILDGLTVPYAIIPGNHDIWPYSSLDEAPAPSGAQLFAEVFAEPLQRLAQASVAWHDGRSADDPLSLQNYAFVLGGARFIAVDLSTRDHAILGNPGVCDPACSFLPKEGLAWLQQNVADGPGLPIVVLSHYPLWPIPIAAFRLTQWRALQGVLASAPLSVLWLSGHLHLWWTGIVEKTTVDVTAAAYEGAMRLVRLVPQ